MTTNAPLVENMMTRCVFVEKRRVPDGQGGFLTSWEDGEEFQAVIVKDRTLAARVAEKQGVTSVYTVTTPVGVGLDFHEVFRRLSDGATFRATSNSADSRPPESAGFSFEQVSAERWELPA